MVTTYIGLGSNLGDSLCILQEAVAKLAQLGPVRVSRLYRTPPMGPQDQPDYYNAAVMLETTLQPLALLDQLQNFEQESGRVRLRHWGERTLDLDLLYYDNQTIEHERLTVPHVGILQREFVLLPLLDLNPNLMIHGIKLKNMSIVQQATLHPIAECNWVEV